MRAAEARTHTSSLNLTQLSVKLVMEEICFCWFGITKTSQEQSFSSCIHHVLLLKGSRKIPLDVI